VSTVSLVTLNDHPEGLHCDIPVTDGTSAGISLAAAGDMGISRRQTLPWRSRLADRLGVQPERLYGLHQVHSRRLVLIDRQVPGETAGIEADGLLSVHRDAVLTVTVADCLPIFLADEKTGAFAIVHSGWRGTGIAREAVAFMSSRLGARPADIAAVIGPGIGACCYKVPEERAASFAEEFGPGTVVRDDGGPPRLDLRAANVRLLQASGVENIRVVTDCTSCSLRLGSYRRQGPADYVLMLAWIGGRAAFAGAGSDS
jgi:hypothetical protein